MNKNKLYGNTIFYLYLLILRVRGQDVIGDNINAGLQVTDGIVKNIGNLIPTVGEILDVPKQIIGGYSAELVLDSVHELCTLGLQAGTIKPPKIPSMEKVGINLLSPCKTEFYKLAEGDKLFKSSNFDRSKKVVILATGWNTNVNDSDHIRVMSKAYFCRGEINFIVFDPANFIATQYFWSAINTDKLGFLLSGFLVDLFEVVPLKNIHLIGHSLGTHLISAAARYFTQKTNGTKILHLTALDPAKPCFNEGETLTGLSRSDAEFIDVIHTNPGALGERKPSGHVDFYTHGYAPLVPGCFNAACAHIIAFKYYAETVYPGNENNFLATRCDSLQRLRNGACNGEKHAMGYAVDKTLQGNYFLEVRSSSPYGMGGTEEREKLNKNCGICEKPADAEME